MGAKQLGKVAPLVEVMVAMVNDGVDGVESFARYFACSRDDSPPPESPEKDPAS